MVGTFFFCQKKDYIYCQPGASAYSLGKELREWYCSKLWLFRAIASLKGIDTDSIRTYEVEPPTLLRVLDAHHQSIIKSARLPLFRAGICDIAEHLETQQVVSSTEFSDAGEPLSADNKEGYLAPETYRIFANASAEEIVKKLTDERMKQLAPLNEAME